MAFNVNPLDWFEVGQRIGKAKKSSLNYAVEGSLADYNTNQSEERKFQRDVALEREKAKIKAEYSPLSGQIGMFAFDPETGTVEQVASLPKGSQVRSKFNPNVFQQKADIQNQAAIGKKQMMGAGAEAGRMALAKESQKNIQDIKNILFPDGTPESFMRSIAAESNIFGGFSEEAQNVFRKAGASLAGRQLISTGVAARPEETEALRKQFVANIKSNPQAAFNALNELQNFYGEYLNTVDPSSMFHQQGSGIYQTGSSGQTPSNSKYQIDQILTISGKDYRVVDNSDPNDPDLEPV